MKNPDSSHWAVGILCCALMGCTTGGVKSGTGESGSPSVKPGQDISGVPAHYKKLQYPLLQYEPPDPADYRVVLENGAVAYLVPDTSLDLVDVNIHFDTRNVPQTPHEAVDMHLYSGLLKAGGTRQLSPAQLEDSLEFIAAGVSADVGDYGAMLSLNSLGQYTYPLLALLGDIALAPRFDREIFDLKKKQLLESITHRYDAPRSILKIAYEHVMYGSHPFNWQINLEEARAAKINCMKKFTGRGFSPSRVVIAASGKFEKTRLLDSLSSLLAEFIHLKKTGRDSVPGFYGTLPPGVYLFDKEVTQASIQVGFPCVQRPHPDYYPLSVASYIFGGGGFTTRLVSKIRTELGLAYSVYSYVASNYYRPGTAGFFLQTKVESGTEAISMCFAEMHRFADSGFTEEELNFAKDGLVKSLPSLFDTPGATADIFAQSELWGRDLDHFKKYPAIIDGLTREKILSAFRRYFKPDSARIILVGPKDKLLSGSSGEQLARLGKITELTEKQLEKKP